MKKLLIYLIFTTTIYAQCDYKVDLEIFPNENRLIAHVNIKESDKNISIDIADFKPAHKSFLSEKLKIGTKSIDFSYEKTLKGAIEKDFIFLGDNWLPKIISLCKYNLNLTLPKGFTAISESEEITKKETANKVIYNFKMQKPIDHINIIASNNFVVNSQTFNEIEISTYFFKEHSSLSKAYIKKVKHYIDMYEKMLGKFPFKTFRVVENTFQTGYSMPTFTLIGSRIIDKPFLIDISLGHEIVHQWFGNSVFNDFEKGNWVEGIAAYLADHYYKELNGEGWEYRKKILDDYESYINEKNIFPLSNFKYRSDKATMTIGYGKGAYAFHSLRKLLGDELFFEGLKAFYKSHRFKYATYTDISEFFSKFSNIDTNETIHNSFEHLDIVDFEPTNINVMYHESKYILKFNIPHDTNVSHGFNLPLVVQSADKNESFYIDVDGNTSISLSMKTRPLKLIFDQDYDLFRKLSPDENIPNLAKLFGDENLSIITDSEKEFNKIKKLFPNATQIKKDDLTFKQMQTKNILFLADVKDLAEKSMATLPENNKGFIFLSEKNPWNKRKVVSFLSASDENEYKKAARKLPHYSKYSNLYFQNGKLVTKTILPTQRGKIYTLAKQTTAVKTPKNISLKDVLEQIEDKKVIFIGESHTNFAHHINQLNIIKELHNRGKKVAIGMEMFQRKFQNVLDDYIAGKIDEKTFLKNSEYFTRWKYNYNLYKPILDFAKTNKIPVIALNLEKEIIKKVTKNGFYALSKEEKALLPKSLNFKNETYKNNLQSFFKSPAHTNALHKKGNNKINTEFVYQSQIIWDETMAESAANYLQKNSDIDSFIVIAGAGHIESSHGIPDRLYRRVSLPYSVILQDMPSSEKTADFVLYTQKLQVKEPLKIGVYLDTKESLKVIKIMKNTIAQDLGIKKDDVILAIDGIDVKTLDEMKFILFFKDKDEKISIKLKRGKKILKLEISL